MKKSLSHLPKLKRDELEMIVNKICQHLFPEQIILFGSYARGDWKDGPHKQGRGQMTIHKRSDYDILVITDDKATANDADLWHKIKDECAKLELSTYVRIIAHDIRFVNTKLAEGQYFFTDIYKEGVMLYDSSHFTLPPRKEISRAEQKRIAQEYFDEAFTSAKEFYDAFEYKFKKQQYKNAAFQLHQAVEHSYKAVLLVFTGKFPREHYLDILGGLAAHECDFAFADIFPIYTKQEKALFDLLDYAYIGARYDPKYKITRHQLEKLAGYVQKLHELTEKICKKKIESFV